MLTKEELQEIRERYYLDVAEADIEKLLSHIEQLEEGLKELQERHERRLLKYDITERQRVKAISEAQRLEGALEEIYELAEHNEYDNVLEQIMAKIEEDKRMDIQKYREALNRFCRGEEIMSVPAQPDDDDFLLSDALDYIERLLPNTVGISGGFDGFTDTRKYTMPIGEYNDLLEKIEQQTQEIERLKDGSWKSISEIAQRENEQLYAKAQRLEEVLKRIAFGRIEGDYNDVRSYAKKALKEEKKCQ
jgi:hypothetical protein